MADFIVLLDNFAEIVKNAKPIEAHTDKYSGGVRGDANLLRTFVLLSAFEDGGRIVPVSFRIKQFNEGNYSSDNKIHMAVTLHEISKGSMVSATAKASNDAVPVAVHASDISILDLLKNINPKDKNFLKYVPESWRSGSEAVPESDSDKRFSLRTPAEVKTELLRNRDNDEHPDAGALAADELKAVSSRYNRRAFATEVADVLQYLRQERPEGQRQVGRAERRGKTGDHGAGARARARGGEKVVCKAASCSVTRRAGAGCSCLFSCHISCHIFVRNYIFDAENVMVKANT